MPDFDFREIGPFATIDECNRVTIPDSVLKEFHLEPGDQVEFSSLSDDEFLFHIRRKSAPIDGPLVSPLGRPLTIKEMNDGIGEAVVESYLRSVGELPRVRARYR
ncbi:AbrB/MazE/SpoVT family DNA-binding domain-containing protein [Roseateles sp. So40a]|uniref:AbrB/MazE/SpoVT family DNA-binding domain-containing protein n=1 Tax=Roseateles sp. So40a TaxID=3400226 RepID=UPI003A853907